MTAELAARWLRVSSGAQDEANQAPDIDAHITASGYRLADFTDRSTPGQPATYTVHGKSASKGKHQSDLDRALDDMRAGRYSVLVVWAADRIERRGALAALQLAELARQAGGRIEYVKDAHLNTANAMSDVMLALAATMARDESARKSERVKAAHNLRRAGGFLTGKVPLGYRLVCTVPGCGAITGSGQMCSKTHPKMAEADPATAPIIRTIYSMFLAGASLRDIKRHLDDTAAAYGPAGGWWPKSIAVMLANTAYNGQRHGDMVHMPPLVDPGDWLAVQAELARRGTRTGSPTTATAWLTSSLRCDKCSGPMYRTAAGRYMRCWGTSRNPSTCRLMLPLADCERQAEAIIADYLSTAPVTAARITGTRDWSDEINAVDIEVAQLLPQLRAGRITAADYATRTAELMSQRADYESRAPRPTTTAVATGMTTVEHWQAADSAARRAWLLETGWTFRADRAPDGSARVWLRELATAAAA